MSDIQRRFAGWHLSHRSLVGSGKISPVRGLGERPQINGTRKVRRDVMVSAAIPRANGDPLPVEYRVRDFAERGPLVIDVMVGGISFLVLKRDEFGGLLDKGGAERLLAFMREKSM